MRDPRPKVLHMIGGRTMVEWVVDTASSLGADPIVVVVGYGHEQVRETLKEAGVQFALQSEQLGTAHAVEQARQLLETTSGDVLVLSGDVPTVSATSLRNLMNRHRTTGAMATMLTGLVDDPTGYGRVIRDKDGHLLKVIEEKDASEAERSIREINGGIYLFDSAALFRTLPLVRNRNKQSEYYLPDVLYILREQKHIVTVEKADNPKEILGVNNPEELRRLDAEFKS